MTMSSEEILRLTVAALMASTGERQGDLAAGLGQAQAQVSRKQAGRAHWTLADADALAAHYRLHVLDLLAGPTHAAGVLRGAAASLQQVVGALPAPPARVRLLATTETAAVPAAVPVPVLAAAEVPARPCVLCGQPAMDEVDGFPQHLSAEECAEAAAPTEPAPAAELHAAPRAAETAPETAATGAPATEAPAPPSGIEAAATEALTPTPAPGGAPVTEETSAAAAAPALDQPPAPAPAPPAPAQTSAAPVRRSAPGYASATLVDHITDRVHEVLAGCEGDTGAAEAALIKSAIPDVMALLKISRVGGRYEHSEFPPTADVLNKRSQKGADQIWEGRPKWRNAAILTAVKNGAQFEVTALDMNAAYLSALKCWLPIGRLREDTSGVHDPKTSGVHLITPPTWEHVDLPNPLGNRQEPGELWVPDSLLRQLLDCTRQGLADAPVIHRSLVSGATETLLEKMRRALAEVRKNALAENDELTVAYVKAMYSKFVSTIGESSANRELRRPDWMHIIRSKAFTNLWLKAHKAQKAGLQVVQISGTDELHVVGDWRSVFKEGRDLSQVKAKDTYILGGKR
ncbi:acyltransferase [Streptomyces laurentii]|uniref:acyltransferase n=1 Tax=Streptomyces laurentii TaxID=39478 RepID=UPI00368A2AAD